MKKIKLRAAGTSRMAKAKNPQGLRLLWSMSALFGRVTFGSKTVGKASEPKSALHLALSA
jgi:hypothetical protein